MKIRIPMNRVEGDLEVSVDIADGVVRDAWAAGTLYRGFEQILVGRGAMDGLVLTPRVCGLCSTSHLSAAARALDRIAKVVPPPDALRLRNVALMAEHVQSDLRQSFLMFAADFANRAYAPLGLHEEAVRRYAPLRGSTAVEVLRETRKLTELIAIIGGQWPHSSFMVPGGVVSVPAATDLAQARLLLRQLRGWYERRVLGCSIERWGEVRDGAGLDAWLHENDAQRDGDLGFVVRLCRELGLQRTGRGHGHFLSFGSLDFPPGTGVASGDGHGRLVPAGFVRAGNGDHAAFDQRKVAEHVAFSWFKDYDGGRHPFEGETRPYASGAEDVKYSWTKAPRFDGEPAEVGPLAEALVGRHPLFVDLAGKDGPSTFLRQLARLVRPATLLPAMDAWLAETAGEGCCYEDPGEIVQGEGFGLIEAARGALGHWVRIEGGTIRHYQIVTPTAWNASPRDTGGVRGPMEEALVGTAVRDPENPVELGHVVRSHDPCLVCTVHTLSRGREVGRLSFGGLS